MQFWIFLYLPRHRIYIYHEVQNSCTFLFWTCARKVLKGWTVAFWRPVGHQALISSISMQSSPKSRLPEKDLDFEFSKTSMFQCHRDLSYQEKDFLTNSSLLVY